MGLVLHKNADPDAYAAAIGMQNLLESIQGSIECSIYADQINYSTKQLAKYLQGFEIKQGEIGTHDLYILFDCGSYHQLGKYENAIRDLDESKVFVLDHHEPQDFTFNQMIIDANYPSTSSLVTQLMIIAKVTPAASTATVLFAGHLYDSRRYLYNTSREIFEQSIYLLDAGGNYNQANDLLQNEMSKGERIARFKAHTRLQYQDIQGHLVVFSHIKSFEASVARSFLGLGADVSCVVAIRDKEIRGSARRGVGINLNLNEIMRQIGEQFGGQGGGHQEAAGFNLPANAATRQEIEELFFVLIKQSLILS